MPHVFFIFNSAFHSSIYTYQKCYTKLHAWRSRSSLVSFSNTRASVQEASDGARTRYQQKWPLWVACQGNLPRCLQLMYSLLRPSGMCQNRWWRFKIVWSSKMSSSSHAGCSFRPPRRYVPPQTSTSLHDPLLRRSLCTENAITKPTHVLLTNFKVDHPKIFE